MQIHLPDRIEKKIARIPFSGCWIWMASGNRYGHLYLNGRIVRAHRALYEMAGHSIPPGMELLHSCDIGLCVNPDHLSIGTHQENMTDMVRKGRAKAPAGSDHWTRHDPERARTIARQNIVKLHGSGEMNNNAKITMDIAASIREAHAANPRQTMTALGKTFGLGREQTRKIIKEIAWKS